MSLFTLFPVFLAILPSLSSLWFFGLLGATIPPNIYPNARNHTLFFFLSGDIYLFLPCLLPAHSSQSLSPDISSHSLSSFTPRPLSNFPALSPIHLPICVPASLDPDNAHFLSLLFSLYLSSHHLAKLRLPPLLYHSLTHLFIHAYIRM